MSYGMNIGSVRRTRFNEGENTNGFAKRAEAARPTSPPAHIRLVATLEVDGTYTLFVDVNGYTGNVAGVQVEELNDRISRLLADVAAELRGEERAPTIRRRDSSPLGIGTPRGNRENLRFG